MKETKIRNENLGAYIKNIRTASNISISEMAIKLNIQENIYTAYECGEISIYADHLIIISKVLDININVLINVYLNS